MNQFRVLTEAEVYIFRDRGVFIDVYKADDKIATSGTTSLADIDLRRTYIKQWTVSLLVEYLLYSVPISTKSNH